MKKRKLNSTNPKYYPKPKAEPVHGLEMDPTRPLYGSKIFSHLHGLGKLGGSLIRGADPDSAKHEAFMKAAADKALLFAQQFDKGGKYEKKWTDALPFGPATPGERVQTFASQLAKGTPIAKYELLNTRNLSNVTPSTPIFASIPPNAKNDIVINLFCLVKKVIINITAAIIKVCSTLL